jgi:DNA invertase Pin-like site-specific DNA recombinase
MKSAIYARVSTTNQTVENQLLELREAAKRMGWEVVAELTDDGISGAKGRSERPSFDKLFRMVQRREIDVVMSWSIDRLGRSLQDLVGFMKEVQASGVELYIHQQAINTATPAGRMIFGIFSALGEYERELIRERIYAGLERAKRDGKKLGRPSHVTPGTKSAVIELRAKGFGINKIARTLRIGVGTTAKILKAA